MTCFDPANRPFTHAVQQIAARYGYQGLARRCRKARSDSWFRNLLTSGDPWAVSPPTRQTFPDLCRLLDVSDAVLRGWIASLQQSPPPINVPRDTEATAVAISLLPTVSRAIVSDLVTHLTNLEADASTRNAKGHQPAYETSGFAA